MPATLAVNGTGSHGCDAVAAIHETRAAVVNVQEDDRKRQRLNVFATLEVASQKHQTTRKGVFLKAKC